jgi:hypothetical protein
VNIAGLGIWRADAKMGRFRRFSGQFWKDVTTARRQGDAAKRAAPSFPSFPQS